MLLFLSHFALKHIHWSSRYRSNIHVDALLITVFARKAHQGNFKRAFITLVDILVCSSSYLAVTPDRSGFRTSRKTRSLCRLGLVGRHVANVNPFRRVFVRGPRLLLSLTLGLFNLSLSASASQCTGDVTAAMAQRERGGRRERSGYCCCWWWWRGCSNIETLYSISNSNEVW